MGCINEVVFGNRNVRCIYLGVKKLMVREVELFN